MRGVRVRLRRAHLRGLRPGLLAAPGQTGVLSATGQSYQVRAHVSPSSRNFGGVVTRTAQRYHGELLVISGLIEIVKFGIKKKLLQDKFSFGNLSRKCGLWSFQCLSERKNLTLFFKNFESYAYG